METTYGVATDDRCGRCSSRGSQNSKGGEENGGDGGDTTDGGDDSAATKYYRRDRFNGIGGRLYCYHSIIQFLKYVYKDFYSSGQGGKVDSNDNANANDGNGITFKWDDLSNRLRVLQSIMMDINSRQTEIVPFDQFYGEEGEGKNHRAHKLITIGSPSISAKEKEDNALKLQIHEKEYKLV